MIRTAFEFVMTIWFSLALYNKAALLERAHCLEMVHPRQFGHGLSCGYFDDSGLKAEAFSATTERYA